MGPGGRNRETSDLDLCGVYYGLVTQNKDPEEIGRVKVRLPWMPGGEEDQSHWAHISVPMAGAEFGTWTVPEVDDTVLVVFLAGDIRHPVVLGGIWNSVDVPPEVNENGKNDFRFVQSRAGHRMLFDDGSNGKVVLTDNKNEQYLGVGKFGKGDGPSAIEIKVPQGGGSSGVGLASANGTVNIWCPNGKLTLKAGKDAKITASDKAEVKSGGDMKLEGKMSATASGTGMAKLEGSKVKIN